ncbi:MULTISPECIES: hypothetical protein [Stenotrophomonas maltophilia group]|uniref:hypothetical protein n=1 Tax=Stenotrophomonas maltophilia group TaxID=995085 RepID=UPI001072081E|nr:hypothetical protein [Stenotrophomonas maltophilia]MCF3498192.1 hypothetical protein [Stenotrophomonas maltophilia]UGB23624.1 hypothetical protein LQ335_10430 [Stenotrophomonas maltophilia]
MNPRNALAMPVLLALALSATSQAATADLSIGGSIEPSPCSLTFTDGLLPSFGDLKPTPSSDGKLAFRGIIDAPLEIECPNATVLTMHFSDQALTGAPMPPKNFFYLLKDDGNEMGRVQIAMSGGKADDKAIDFVNATGNSNGVRADDPDGFMQMGWNKEAFSRVTGMLNISVIGDAVDPAELTDSTKLTSRIGIELNYL